MSLLKGVQQKEVSEQRRMPVDNVGADAIQSITGETVQLYYYNSGVKTIDAGQIAGVVAVGKLAYRNIKNALGDVTGHNLDTSVAFTSTAFTNQVDFPHIKAEGLDLCSGTVKATNITEGFVNGDYCIDHRTGTIYGVKADASVTLTGTSYLIETSTSGGGGVSSDANITKVAGVAVPTAGADAVSNTRSDVPTSSRISGFNGTTWDRIKAGITTVTATLTGWLNTLPWAIYNATPTTRTEGQGGPLQATAEGSLKTRGDNYDTSSGADKAYVTNSLNSELVNSFINIDTTNVGAGPTYYPAATGISLDGQKSFSFSGKLIEGDAEDNIVTVQVTNDEDTTNADWQTVYFTDLISDTRVADYTCNATTVQMAGVLENLNFRYVRIKFVGGASATNTIIIKGRTCTL